MNKIFSFLYSMTSAKFSTLSQFSCTSELPAKSPIKHKEILGNHKFVYLFFLAMKYSKVAVPTMVAFVLLLLLCPASEAAIACSDVIKDLRPCVNYLVSGSGMPPAACCTGASNLASAASTSADRKAACNCIKTAAKKINPNPQLAKALPGNCKINLPFTVSPNVDCSKIS